MKKTFIYSLMIAALALVSCNKSVLDDLTGVYPAAQDQVLTTLSSSATVKTDKTREFSLKFTGENGASFETVLIQARVDYALKAGSFVPGTTNGSFDAARTKVNGKAVTDKAGVINVRNSGGSDYGIDYALFDVEGNPYRGSWKGTLVYEPDPEPVVLSVVLSAQSNLASGTKSVTMSLATAGVTYDAASYSYKGNGNYLGIDLYSADGYLHEGTYKASAAGGVINEGEFGIGWDPGDLWGIGMVFENWGTCWWTVNGTATAQKITSGEIVVAKKGSKWTITWGSEASYPNWAEFQGEIPDLTAAGAPAPDYTYTESLGGAVDNTFTPVAGVTTHSLALTKKGDAEPSAWFDLVLTEGVTDLSGVYTTTEYAHEDHTCGNGYDLSAMGWGVGGCRYMKDNNLVLIEVGAKVTVTSLGEGVYEISGEGFDFIFGNVSGGVDADYTIKETLGGAVDNTFTAVAGVTTHSLALTKKGDAEPSAWFDLVLTEGVTDLSGEYTTTEYAHEDHTCGNGYDLSAMGWGVGGCRYMDGTNLVLIAVGAKVNVTAVSDGVYKISGEGFEFVGEMAE